MKLCFLAPANSIHSFRWIKFFTNKHLICWISFHEPLPVVETLKEKIEFHYLPLKWTNPISVINVIRQVKNIVKTFQPQVMHVHSAGAYGMVGYYSGFMPKIVTAWGSDVLLTPWYLKWLTRRILKQADAITSDGENTIAAMIKLGADPSKMNLIRFGVDTKTLDPQKIEPFPMEPKPKGLLVISLRSLYPLYDIESLIRAVPTVVKNFPDTHFLIGGSGTQKEFLEKLCDELKIKDNVSFLGMLNSSQIAQYLKLADIYVSTSLSDSDLAASTAEAMAMEKPVVITDSGDNRKWVKDGINGFIVPVKNPTLLAEKIVWLIKNPEDRKKISQNNRSIIIEKNDYGNEMAKVERVYEKISQAN